MKKLLLIFLLLFSFTAYSQISTTDKLSSLCKVWGFLKYFHPKVAAGKYDWDKVFVKTYNTVMPVKDKEQLNRVYKDLIAALGEVKPCKKCNLQFDTVSFKDNKSTTWIDDKNIFTDELIDKLHFIERNKDFEDNEYVSSHLFINTAKFDSEKKYPDSVFPGEQFRVLTLARYWNIINYYFPYKYAIGEDWNAVLDRMAEKFSSAKDTLEYNFAIAELIASSNDSHAWFATDRMYRSYGKYFFPFGLKYVGGNFVVDYIYNDSLTRANNLKKGDVIASIDNKSADSAIAEYSKYISASNYGVKQRFEYNILWRSHKDSSVVAVEREGKQITQTVRRYNFPALKWTWTPKKKDNHSWKMLEDSIGYVDMGNLLPGQVNAMMQDLKNTQAIVFDIRNYPQGTMYKIANHICDKHKPFASFTAPYFAHPGVFKKSKPYMCGKNSDGNYKGKVVLLVNEETQSHAEFTCMALQTAPNVTTIGSQTAGADGNVTTIPLPGNYSVWMTGLGVYYPDWKETQRVGIHVDIESHPTAEGISKGKDDVMDRAIEYIHTGK
jgi:carboxyl-terminal processing protease